MSALDHPGLAGAAGALALGAVQYVLAMAVIRRVVIREIEEGGDLPGLGGLARRLRSVRNVVAGVSFVAFPALGFALGTTLGSQAGGVR